MKMVPIEFIESYGGDLFKPYKEPKGFEVFDRTVVVTPRRWKQGAYILFSIIDNFVESKSFRIPPVTRKVREQIPFHDKDHPKSSVLMRVLASDDIRGTAANDAAFQIYWELFLFTDPMRNWLPRVVEHYEKIKAEMK